MAYAYITRDSAVEHGATPLAAGARPAGHLLTFLNVPRLSFAHLRDSSPLETTSLTHLYDVVPRIRDVFSRLAVAYFSPTRRR